MVEHGWYHCPTCGKHVQKITEESVVYNTPFYCRNCKVDWYPAIYMGREIDEDTPFVWPTLETST